MWEFSDSLSSPAILALSNFFPAPSFILEMKQPCRALQSSHSLAIFRDKGHPGVYCNELVFVLANSARSKGPTTYVPMSLTNIKRKMHKVANKVRNSDWSVHGTDKSLFPWIPSISLSQTSSRHLFD